MIFYSIGWYLRRKNFFNEDVSNIFIYFINSFIQGTTCIETIGITQGIEPYFIFIELSNNLVINCIIYDTGGIEKYKTINENFYKKADGIILVYDITIRSNFNKIKDYYFPKIKELCKKNVKVLLLGNKTDLEDEREVSIEEGRSLVYRKILNLWNVHV